MADGRARAEGGAVMLRHDYVDHVAALCAAALVGRGAPATAATAIASIAIAEELAALRFPGDGARPIEACERAPFYAGGPCLHGSTHRTGAGTVCNYCGLTVST
jgi:hypothetical protein